MESFELLRSETIAELNTEAKIYRHKATGAELLSMENDDENKCFGIAFRTPPSDSTGIAHILEHTVLCGSRKYPVKDPFVQLLKGSLQTFLNAFTYPDKTCYPVASQNLADFHNLVDVYLDAVFHPLITEDFFKQEGWHYELENKDDALTFKGVVFNEMKGVYSSPDSLLMEAAQQSLFPDTTYGLDSGGAPAAIPELTYEAFTAFHKRFYHPSNARIFFYGDDSIEERFAILEEYLKDYSAIAPNSDVAIQQPFAEPLRVEKVYAVDAEDEDPKPMISLNWALPHPAEPLTHLALELLNHILIGATASPLRKELIESGLGEDLTSSGMETHMLQMAYYVGLKGVKEENLPAVEALIQDTLKDLAENGIPKGDIDAAINTIEFELRENNTGGFPRGLSIMLKALNAWNYDADPLALVSFEDVLTQLHKSLADDPRFFEKLIQKHFIDNPHRSILILRPDPEAAAREEAREQAQLDLAESNLSEADREQLVEETNHLQKLQATPDSPESIATIPLLKREDLDKAIRHVERKQEKIAETPTLLHPLFTNGILYLDLSFDVSGLPAEDIPYLCLLGSAMLEMGTKNEDYVSLSQRISCETGGISTSLLSTSLDKDGGTVTRFNIRSKCMIPQCSELLDILHDIMLLPSFDQQERFKQILLEHKMGMESAIVPNGHMTISTRMAARNNRAGWLREQTGGFSGLQFLRQLLDDVDNNWPAVAARYLSVAKHLFTRDSLLVNVTVSETEAPKMFQCLESFLEKVPMLGPSPAADWPSADLPNCEALTGQTMVNYVGRSANLYNCGYELHGSSLAITNYLRTAWLWEKIRVQGGAYGGRCGFDMRSGNFSFSSYRDPNIVSSLEAYDQTADFLKNLELDEDELTRALIGAIGQLDAYQLPDAKGYSDTLRYLLNYSDEERQKLRDEVLATTVEDFHRFGEALEKAMINSCTVIVASPESIAAARKAGLQLDAETRIQAN